tara:strand:- start:1276 stop:1554 length:279 start_codon:yes stop_codon:yes gene_type:complete
MPKKKKCVMDKNEILLFINERMPQLQMMAARQFSGQLTKAEVKGYEDTYKTIHGNARVCFTCGNSAQTMARVMLNFAEENKPKPRAKRRRKK